MPPEEKAKPKIIEVVPADFIFNGRIAAPREAVRREEEIWRKSVEDKYAGKLVAATGRIRRNQNSGDHDFELMVTRMTIREPQGKTKDVEWGPVSVRMADRKFILTAEELDGTFSGPPWRTQYRKRRLVGKAELEGVLPSASLKLREAKFDD
jgi:hypothetical protein